MAQQRVRAITRRRRTEATCLTNGEARASKEAKKERVCAEQSHVNAGLEQDVAHSHEDQSPAAN